MPLFSTTLTIDNFVIDNLLLELEEIRDFKLCIHSRNFTPGRDIKDNIEESINNSNSAIIVMSQGFVDSIWCKEEFTHCYIENMMDSACNLFVIMMQPADTFVNLSNYMKTFFANKTYLQKDDPDLFHKLAVYLENATQTDKEYVDNDKQNINSDEELKLHFHHYISIKCHNSDQDDDDDDEEIDHRYKRRKSEVATQSKQRWSFHRTQNVRDFALVNRS